MVSEKEYLEEEENKKEEEKEKTDIFSTEEIEIEEMAIDGICGVY